MKASEIRRKFLDFFAGKGHKMEPSASLIPVDDPTLLWINSGVATLKKYFDGRVKPDNPRIVNSQKSIRTNDIENVGYTARHHTFFEMLGNFSVGDYFKEEAITWAWEFLTDSKWMGLNPDRLSVTIHSEDDEAYRIWKEKIGLPDERIIRLKENFWDIGEGPSGPNTEIFYDRGESLCDPDDPECYPGGENERYLEIWNLVFSQFNHNPDGTYTPLPKKNIDTGMGLERMASVMQDVSTNYDTDLFQPIIQATCDKAGVVYGKDKQTDIALKVIADHARTIVFAVSDGALPSNEGRGYVIRRLLRRAVRYGRKLGIERPFLYKLTSIVTEIMKDYYPEPVKKQAFIERVIKNEEEKFLETLTEGLHILERVIAELKARGKQEISGQEAFKLYDTYGFPVDLTEEIAREQGFSVDHKGFDEEMERQRERARMARQDVDSMQVQGGALSELQVKSEFVGYGQMECETTVAALIHEDRQVEELVNGQTGLVILAETPFYAESGGQVADQGSIRSVKCQLRVVDVQKGPRGEHIHSVEVESGAVRVGEKVKASIDRSWRQDTIRNHTATHLVHQALKNVLGEHVNQAGSLVAPNRLRFDFTHISAMTPEEIKEVERCVNEQIWENTKVETMIKPLDEAKAMGAMALFGEKYGDMVRVVQIGNYSLELCGGTHVQNTGEIGLFKIVSESGIGSGIRRIEAVTGRHCYRFIEEQLGWLAETSRHLKAKLQDVPERTRQLQNRLKELERENESLTARINRSMASKLADQVQETAGIPVLAAQVEAGGMDQLRSMMDDLRQLIGEGVIVLGASSHGKVSIVASVSPKYVKEGLHAGKLVKEVAGKCGGGGGGRPEMAQAGGKKPERLPAALAGVSEWIRQQISLKNKG
ncbi:alanine--tRNA ligase [Thermoactinomyces mirandus]|uniref:Alanine--tRNA ligase n=1 Tax=Thermoactinomyces mirandus TaxID=2756294 RepID=A0A7W1XQI1_9BACL|nr:alanine--tRNA ligase [Thermoactinomyces mirandus]MBA4601322.1 alanine--tRNA ligase [Thermoactinomyces mirandus]